MKKCIALVLFFTICLCPLGAYAYPADKLHSAIEGIINWKKLDNGSAVDGFLINGAFLEAAGTTAGDWFPIGLGRYGYKDDYDAYLAVIGDVISRRYKEPGKLSSAKATEWHRIALAVLAMGGDPTNIGAVADGTPVNLIADGTYNRGKTASLGKQGINGWIWGLIALDSLKYPGPAGAFNTRDDIITEILKRQLLDGGFALTGNASDPDISAMALQALAPYCNGGKKYTYTNSKTKQDMSKTVRGAVDETLAVLSSIQTGDGDYFSWGTQNVESTVQVLTAVCALGINPDKDSRFIKNGNTLIDGIMKYRQPNGGFIHSFVFDSQNPSAVPGKVNSMASEQALYGLVAYDRFVKGLNPLYDFRPEGGVPTAASPVEETKQVPVKTAEPGEEVKVEPKEEKEETPPEETGETAETVTVVFTDGDKAELDALPARLTTEHFVTVLKLIYRAEQAGDFPEKRAALEKLYDSKRIITEIQNGIEDINQTVTDKLYPFEKISLKDKATVDGIVARYNALSEYDRQKILCYEDIAKTKTQVDNLLRAIVISAVLFVLTAAMGLFIVLRIKKRRKRKMLDRMELGQEAYESLDGERL
jgi:hypothetical protein